MLSKLLCVYFINSTQRETFCHSIKNFIWNVNSVYKNIGKYYLACGTFSGHKTLILASKPSKATIS